MKGRIKYGKVLLVTFITILIWVWADTSKYETEEILNIPIQAKSSEENLWLSFDGKSSERIKSITIWGPQSQVTSIKKDSQKGKLELEFYLEPSDVGLSEPGQSSFRLVDFINKSEQFRHLGIEATECEPNTLTVQAVKLQERQLTVKCMSNNIEVEPKSIEPATVTMLVPSDWPPERCVAIIELSKNEIEQAKLNPIAKKAFVTFSSDQQPEPADTEIMVQMPPNIENLKPFSITGATIGYSYSSNLQGKYKVELSNETDLSSFTIIATPAAKAAYDAQPYKITLYILDEDKDKLESNREVIYNFPIEFIIKGQIKLNQEKEVAKFKLKPVSNGTNSSGVH